MLNNLLVPEDCRSEHEIFPKLDFFPLAQMPLRVFERRELGSAVTAAAAAAAAAARAILHYPGKHSG